MLNPDSRLVAFDFLIPPDGYQLEFGVLTTYTLDLEVMLAVPLQLLTSSDKGIESLHESPIQLLEALREAGEKMHVFVDRSGIAIPGSHRELYAALESSLHPVKAPNGGVFHPKLWILKFVDEDEHRPTVCIRLAVLSRNLTLDRSWDIALVSEGWPYDKRKVAASRELADLIRQLPAICTGPTDSDLMHSIETLADEVSRTRFLPPEGFHENPIEFTTLGISGASNLWKPIGNADRILAIAPFVNARALDQIPVNNNKQNVLISRQIELDCISPHQLERWDKVYVLHEQAEDEPDDFAGRRPSGLHAKLLAYEQGNEVSWYVGSANLTAAAFSGTNVEVMARISARLPRRSTTESNGIAQFMESEFRELLKEYIRSEDFEEEAFDFVGTEAIEATRDVILDAELSILCKPKANDWTWRLRGSLSLPSNGVVVTAWPVTIDEQSARTLSRVPLEMTLAACKLTSLVAFRLQSPHKEVEDISFVLNLSAEGMPDDRLHHLLVSLIDDWDKFRAFLRALLGGLEDMGDLPKIGNKRDKKWSWDPWNAEALLEDLVRSASRDPERLDPIRRLVSDIRSTEEGKEIIPDEFLSLWNSVVDSVEEGREQ